MGSTVRQGFWSTDWFAGLLVAVVFFFARNGGLLQSLDDSVYDAGARLSSRAPSDRLAIVAIDRPSIDSVGRWPLPRVAYAKLIELLRQGHAKVVGVADPLVAPERDPGLNYITDLEEFYLTSNMARSVPTEIERIDEELVRAAAYSGSSRNNANEDAAALRKVHQLFAQSSLAGELEQEIATLGAKLAKAAAALNPDLTLADNLRSAGNTVLGMAFESGTSAADAGQRLPEYVLRNGLLNVVDRVGAVSHRWFPPAPPAAQPPLPELAMAAAGIGHLGFNADPKQHVRAEPLVLLHHNTYLPSLALQLAARSRDLSLDEIQVLLGEGVRLGDMTVATDSKLQMRTYYYGNQAGQPPFSVESFHDVLTGRIPATRYRDKIVLVGTTVDSLAPSQPTPVSAAMPAVLLLAHSVSTLLNGDFFLVPEWHALAEYGVFLLVTLYIALAFPWMNARLGVAVTAGLVIALPITQLALMAAKGLVLELMVPAALLVVGSLVLTAKRALLPAAVSLKSEAGSAESNRMLGLAFQGQGQLDMAFDPETLVPTYGYFRPALLPT